MRTLRLPVLIALLVLLGCAGHRAVSAERVIIRDTTMAAPGLSPAVLTITPGQTVEWVNRTGHSLRFTFDRRGLKYPRLVLPDGSARAVFPEVGTYPYQVHLATERQLEKFEGRIVVLAEPPAGAGAPSGPAGPAPPGSAPDLGLSLQDLTPALAAAFHVKEEKGALVTKVAPGSQAEREGLREGDIVTAVNKTPVTGAEAFTRVADAAVKGETLLLRVVREDRVFFVVLTR